MQNIVVWKFRTKIQKTIKKLMLWLDRTGIKSKLYDASESLLLLLIIFGVAIVAIFGLPITVYLLCLFLGAPYWLALILGIVTLGLTLSSMCN